MSNTRDACPFSCVTNDVGQNMVLINPHCSILNINMLEKIYYKGSWDLKFIVYK
jgi:hypothetical protein